MKEVPPALQIVPGENVIPNRTSDALRRTYWNSLGICVKKYDLLAALLADRPLRACFLPVDILGTGEKRVLALLNFEVFNSRVLLWISPAPPLLPRMCLMT